MVRDPDPLFPCEYASCGQTFQSSEALKSHQKKHSLSLRLTDPSDDTLTDPSHDFASPPAMPSLREEMPTPRRFLKEFERNSAFLDDIVGDGGKRCATSTVSPITSCITENPFAETFRRASFSKEPVPQRNELHVPNETESLNTPSIQLNASNENPLARLSRRSLSEEESGRGSPPSHLHHKLPVPNESSIIKQAIRTADIPMISITPSANSESKQLANLSQSVDGMPAACSSTHSSIVPGLNIVHTITLPAINPQIPVVPAVIAVKNRITPAPRMGRILPKPSPSLTAAQVVRTVATSNGMSSLKPIAPAPNISQPKTAESSSAVSSSTIRIMSQEWNHKNDGHRTGAGPRISTTGCGTSAASSQLLKPGRRKKGQRVPSAEEQRRLSLDRNREAAQRCRMKKKQWAQEAEERADALTDMNNRLQMEVATLRNEVLSLKTALLAHRDCSVTLQQLRLTVQPQNAAGQSSF